MAKPYMEPKMRQKMAAMPSAPAPAPMDEGGDMGGGDGAPAGDDSPNSTPTAFLPKEMGGGKQWKPGDEIVLKIDAVDPETGEMQVSYAPEEPGADEGEQPGAMDAFDKTMPDQPEGQ